MPEHRRMLAGPFVNRAHLDFLLLRIGMDVTKNRVGLLPLCWSAGVALREFSELFRVLAVAGLERRIGAGRKVMRRLLTGHGLDPAQGVDGAGVVARFHQAHS